VKFDLKKISLSEVNEYLQNYNKKSNNRIFKITNPNGNHAICAGLKDDIEVNVDGHAGYYFAGMNMNAKITIYGNVGTGTAHGGTLIIDGNTSSRCGISMKGVDIIVKGSVGHMSAFMAQSGNLLICGDAGEALGDSIYEAKIFIKGKVKSLGADCEEKKIDNNDKKILKSLLDKAGLNKENIQNFKMYGSARKLYNFNIDNVSEY